MSHDPLMSPRERFEGYYAAPQVPWDIGRPQRVFLEAEQAITRLPNGRRCRVLDIGCGTGDLSLWLAERGCTVTGIDFLFWPIQRAKQKASDRGLTVNFLQMDALAIGQIPERFDSVTDCGLFHVFDDSSRAAYVAALSNLLEPGAHLFLLCFSDAEPGSHGPRRVSQGELRATFAEGWQIEQIQTARFESVVGIPGAEFTQGGAMAWFASVRRTLSVDGSQDL